MTADRPGTGSSNDEFARAMELTIHRLRGLGVVLDGMERPEELVRLEEAIGRFETVVEARGGDLMVDEGIRQKAAEPDDEHFRLPLRERHESIPRYLERIERAIDIVRRHGGID